ncbi:MAG TPA: hemerythrin domain-containing protein [Planctomycetota bacterium]|jgi:iron-sulfur cluster repair protein YtfE (RIC family)|nr:hemerythrin domain-containing protein [Planctomycetota bacterium]
MTDTRLKAVRATLLLMEDHHRIEELLSTYSSLGPEEIEQKEDIFAMVRAELSDHATVEEEIFYPVLAQVDQPEAELKTQLALEEHQIVRTLLDELSDLSPGELDFEAKMKILKDSVERHAEEEEKVLFKLFKKLPREVQDDVSERLRERKLELGDGFGA